MIIVILVIKMAKIKKRKSLLLRKIQTRKNNNLNSDNDFVEKWLCFFNFNENLLCLF